jgi:hypothetical protein
MIPIFQYLLRAPNVICFQATSNDLLQRLPLCDLALIESLATQHELQPPRCLLLVLLLPVVVVVVVLVLLLLLHLHLHLLLLLLPRSSRR